MSLIDKTYFVGELDVANTNIASVEARLQWFIDKYEPEFLRLLFGADLYTNYAAGILVDPIADEWIALQDLEGLDNAIACYVYFHYMRDRNSFTTSVGEVKPEAENAKQAEMMWKSTRAINEAVRWVKGNTLVEFLNTNIDNYPGWVIPRSVNYWYHGEWTTTSILFREIGLYVNPVIDL